MNKIKTILVIDDEPDICELLKYYFEEENIHVEYSYGGTKALDIIKNQKIDFILSDIRMIDGDGVSMKRELNENGNKTPFLFMSAFSDLTIDEAKEMGALGILKKPFDLYEIQSILDSLD